MLKSQRSHWCVSLAAMISACSGAAAQGFMPVHQAPAPTADVKPFDSQPLDTSAIPDRTGGIYWITLSGTFAQDITQTPIRNAFEDARKYRPDIIVIEIDNTVTLPGDDAKLSPEMEKLYENIGELFRAEKFLTVPTQEVPARWGYSPRIVYWVKRALGGISFMPLSGKEVYFAPDGKLGGVGDLDLFLQMGHERVVRKQMSLRLAHGTGWVNHSGFPQAELLTRALVMKSAVVSLRFVNGRPQLFEGYPTNPAEELLTDDGEVANADTLYQLARGLGNDVLTLDERTAKLIGLSKGTVATRDELLSTLGVERGAVIDGRSDRIMNEWSTGLDHALATLERLAREVAEVQVQGDYNQRRTARSTQIAKLEQIKSIATRWNEGFEPYQINAIGLPPGADGVDIAAVQQTIDRIRMEQSLDRR